MESELKPWTKEEYLLWLETRGDDPAEWEYLDCKQADELIAQETLGRLEAKLVHLIPPDKQGDALREWIVTCANIDFGSAETERMLMALDCYPEWIIQEKLGPA